MHTHTLTSNLLLALFTAVLLTVRLFCCSTQLPLLATFEIDLLFLWGVASFQYPWGLHIAFVLPLLIESQWSTGWVALGCTITHKVNKNSGLEYTEWKVETCNPAPNITEQEQTLYMVTWSFNYTKTDVSTYRPMFCGEINVCLWEEIKLSFLTLMW